MAHATPEERDFEWLTNWQEPTTTVELRGGSCLYPQDDGAILVWMFDQLDKADPVLVIRLTEEEAQAVFDADPFTVGMIEPIRRRMRHPWAFMTVVSPDNTYVCRVRIPTKGTEREFIGEMDAIAAACPVYRKAPRRSSIPVIEHDPERRHRVLELVGAA